MDELELYQKLAYDVLMARCKKIRTNRKVSLAADIRGLKGLIGKYPKRVDQLSINNTKELNLSKLRKAKNNYLHYRRVKKSHPEIVTEGIEKIMDDLANKVAKWEGALVKEAVEGYDDFDILKFKETILKPEYVRKIDAEFLYELAKKYRGRKKLIRKNDNNFSNWVTIFLDETLKENPLNPNGTKICNYSYIIANGNLKNESEINLENTIFEKIGQSHANKGEEVTLEAIGDALFTLSYMYNYTKNVKIYIDNMSVLTHWKRRKKSYAVTQCFNSISVNFVERKHNKKADELSRRNVVVTLSIRDFKKLANIKYPQNQIKAHKLIPRFIRKMI